MTVVAERRRASKQNPAISRAARHGKPAILLVDARGMYGEGMRFYVADNGVWLTDHVPSRFLKLSGAVN